MQCVGLHLQTTAYQKSAVASDLDFYGRSAFNRYYYATFLEVRAMLRRCRPGWRGNHDSVPRELESWVKKGISDVQKKASRISDNQSVQICKAATASVSDLSRLMVSAYAVRVIADYEPEIPIILDGDRFTLERTSVTDAHSWLARARADITKIERAWNLSDEH